MIQRKQSLWLIIAALLNAAIFLVDVYRASWTANGITTTGQVRIADHFPSVLACLSVIIMPMVTIFMFRNRKKQMKLTSFSILFEGIFLSNLLIRVDRFTKELPAGNTGNYWIGAVLPVAAFIFLFMAILAIRADEKLVRSADRLR